MSKSKIAFRIGISVVIIGLAIFFSNLTTSLIGSTTYSGISIPPDGTENLVTYLSNRPYEIRILVPEDFNGTLYIFNYEGIKKLTEGTKTALIEKPIEGPLLIDFTPNRRGPYMILIESKISTQVGGSINLVEKEAISQDIQGDSVIIILFGLAITSVTLMFRSSKLLKKHLLS